MLGGRIPLLFLAIVTVCSAFAQRGPEVLRITPSDQLIPPLGSMQYTATLLYFRGSGRPGGERSVTTAVTWFSSDKTIATIDPQKPGLVHSTGKLGPCVITAKSGPFVKSVQLTVSTATLSSITVTPTMPSIPLGLNVQFAGIGNYSDGSHHDLTTTSNWSSGSPTVAAINNLGSASTLTQGPTLISAASGGQTGSTTLTVAAPVVEAIQVTPANATLVVPATQQYTATAVYSNGSTQDVTNSAVWSSTSPSFASISSTGLATTIAAGTTNIQAAALGHTGSTQLLVQLPPNSVMVQSGILQGVVEGGVLAFRGVPYAAPPVGNLRWRPPAPPLSWQGIRDASMFGNVCPQTDFNGGVRGNEDCLTLNIYSTDPPPNPTQPQPVAVFFHGGGQRLGDVQSPPYDPAPPLAIHGVIVVTVEYRIGLLGFFAHPLLTAEGGGSSGNYSLMDMIAALRWVRDNITAFGGDPSRVMMFGQSAGSINVQALLVAPPAQGLFSRAGMESGVTPSGQFSLAAAYPLYAQLVPLVGCDTATDVLACLRAVPAVTIVQTQLLPGKFPVIGFNLEPIVIPVDPFDKLQQQGSPVPLLIGSTREEATGLGDDPNAPLTNASYAAAVHAEFDPFGAGVADQVLKLYPASAYDTPAYALIAVDSDFKATCETRNLARATATGAQRPAVWRYFFTHRYENNTFLNQLRAFHTAELYFVFGNLQNIYYTDTPYTPSAAEVTFSNEMMDYWARFAASGDPNGAGATPWLRYNATNENILQLDETFLTINGYHNPQCDYLSTLPQP